MADQGVPEDYEVHIKDDRIVSVLPSSGKHDSVKAKLTYVILEEYGGVFAVNLHTRIFSPERPETGRGRTTKR
jgi:hypothetical protein